MTSYRRIRTIYNKELVAILRDHRTLIAMVVVPIVLYPVLMLGSIQAVSFQVDSMAEEQLIIGVQGETLARNIRALIDKDTFLLQREQKHTELAGDGSDGSPIPLEHFQVNVFTKLDELEEAVRTREIQIGVTLAGDALSYDVDRTNKLRFYPDHENIRSQFALKRLRELFKREGDRVRTQRKERSGLPETYDQPFEITVIDLSTPSSLLGMILPLILILMTITGAIYPAIDLTAGERERGTLESIMVCPTPVIDFVVGKFLVVSTVAIMGAALNLASVSATVYFGGFDKIIAGSGGGVPFGKMVLILFCLVPFAVLMSAIMIAVCSYARTFKEAQNYVTPVILAVLIPGGIAALPATRLEGITLVMPVGNMVLLTRDFLLGVSVPMWQIAMVLLSTVLYAVAAVAVAASIFGRESVVFADAASLTSMFSRRTIKPGSRPSPAMGLLIVALLFPTWFFIQSSLSSGPDQDASPLLFASAWLMPILFVLVPLAILLYWKVDAGNTFSFRMPTLRHAAGALLLGLSARIPAHELNVLQESIIGIPPGVLESMEVLAAALFQLPLGVAIVLIALVPAICEELLFRGFLLSSLSSGRKWTAIIVSAAIFGVFHFIIFRFLVTAAMGVLLAYVVWQTRSIWPAMMVHFVHNAAGVLAVTRPDWFSAIGLPSDAEWAHLPIHILVIGGIVFVVGFVAATRPSAAKTPTPVLAF